MIGRHSVAYVQTMPLAATITDTISDLRHLGRAGRRQNRRMAGGQTGCWTGELAVSGLEEERRRTLVAAMNAKLGSEELEPVNDGRLHARGHAVNINAYGAALLALCECSSALRDAGITDDELQAATISLTVTPEPADPSCDRPFRPGAQTAVSVAMCSNDDVMVRRRSGDHEALTLCEVEGLDFADPQVRQAADRLLPGVTPDEDGVLAIQVPCLEVGTPLGALYLVLTKMDDLFCLAAADGAIKLASALLDDE